MSQVKLKSLILEREFISMVSIPIYKATMCSPVLNVVQFVSMEGKEKDFAALDPAKTEHAWKYFVGC